MNQCLEIEVDGILWEKSTNITGTWNSQTKSLKEKLTTDIKKVWFDWSPEAIDQDGFDRTFFGDSIPRRGKSLPSTTSIFNLRGQVENSGRIWTKLQNAEFWNLTLIVVWGPQLHVKKRHSHRALVAFQMLSNCRISFQQLYKIIRTHEIQFLQKLSRTEIMMKLAF